MLIEKFPELILQDRLNHAEYTGQTPLHMAVCKGNLWLVRTLMNRLSKKKTKQWKEVVLKKQANGTIFNNTVMLGQLPLSIAALTFNKGTFASLTYSYHVISLIQFYGPRKDNSMWSNYIVQLQYAIIYYNNDYHAVQIYDSMYL